MKKADFRTFYRDAHAVECLSRQREDAHRSHRGDDAIVRPVSRPAPCGRKESGDDGGRTGRSGGCHRCGGCWRAGVAESENQAKKQELITRDYKRDHTTLRAGHVQWVNRSAPRKQKAPSFFSCQTAFADTNISCLINFDAQRFFHGFRVVSTKTKTTYNAHSVEGGSHP